MNNTPTSIPEFDPAVAFSRTIGWITREELKTLQNKTVAIAGLGGVGGSHLITLTRLGVGKFHLAEFDKFGMENFNRQYGANMTTIGRNKLDVMVENALKINPNLQITTFPAGVTPQNIDQFLDGVDLYVDGLDYFVFKTRSMVYKKCAEKKIAASTAGPIAMGAALLNFLPGGMSFHDYFNWKDNDSDVTLAIKFLIGLTPSAPHRWQLVDPDALNLKARKGPSTPMGCELCSGVVGVEAMKILLNRKHILSAPYSLHFDAYTNTMHKKWIPMGNRNPWQKLKIYIGTKKAMAELER